MKHIAGLTSLQWLGLSSTQITNEELQHLRAIPTLRNVLLAGTNVSDDVEALLPYGVIHRGDVE
jgi:hypothetical protein